ncbi:hypothetical protein [Sulfitobacter sp. JB4-11]|uniref:hypothetical protein n=1 Tax=Sulfitobacter rhodophyticola TaxID=3238304 RepID=UPI003513A3AD
MAFVSDPKGARGIESDRITLAQAIFAAVGLTIILGGLWLISEMNAPYHPDGAATAGDVMIVADD